VPASPQLDAALAYAAIGWRVFPCAADKRPVVKRWPHVATVELDQIIQWWSHWPDARIGHPTGDGVFVLDGDDQAALDGLIEDPSALPPTVQACTPRPGHHFFFTAEGLVKTIAPISGHPGLDIRGDGGYVLLPSPLDEGRVWVTPPTEQSIAPAPSWLLTRLTKPAPRKPPSSPSQSGRVGHGGRNSELASLAGGMRRHGLCEDAIGAALEVENHRRCDPPLGVEEVRRIAHSIARYEPSADVRASLDDLTGLLGLDTVGRQVTQVASYGPRGGRSEVYLRLDDGSQVALCPLSAYATVAKLTFEIAAQTMAMPEIKACDVLRVVALIRALSQHSESVEVRGRALDLGAEYLREAAIAEVRMSDQTERFRAFAKLEKQAPYVRAEGAHLVVRDPDTGSRYARAQWLKEYLRKHADPGEITPILRELEKSGWTQPGREGRIKATSPTSGAPLQWSFWVVPSGWDEA
jgi:hypothetical protein